MDYKKRFGQNFISDTNFLGSLVALAGITADDEVLEIGAGAGGLTSALAKTARRVVSYEIDRELKPVLDTLGFPNLEVIYKDILKEDNADVRSRFSGPFKLAANLPYYITTPVIFKFLEPGSGVSEMALMVQKEVGERITASPGTKSYGALTVAVNTVADAKILKNVGRKMFFPVPNVDSCFINIKLAPHKFEIKDRAALDKLIKTAFSMRRKTLVNNLMQGFGLARETAEGLLADMGIDAKARGETLPPERFAALAGTIYERGKA